MRYNFKVLGVPISIGPWRWWKFMWHERYFFALFTSRPWHIPDRAGFMFLGLDVGWRQDAPPWLGRIFHRSY